MKIFIPGCSGYIGSLLTERMLREGHEVVGLDNFFRSNGDALTPLCDLYRRRFKFIYGNALDEKLMEPLIKEADIILALVGLVGEPVCKQNRDLATLTNIDCIRFIAETKRDETFMFYPSTGSVYGNIGEFCSEEVVPKPISHYAITKLEAEYIVFGKPNTLTYRFSTLYGLSYKNRVNLLLNNLAFDAIHRGVLEIYQPDFKRSFVHVRDTIEAIAHGVKHHDSFRHNMYNVGSPEGNWTKREAAEYIKELTGCCVFYPEEGYKDPDQRNYFVDFKRIYETGWTPRIFMEEGIESLVSGVKLLQIKSPYD